MKMEWLDILIFVFGRLFRLVFLDLRLNLVLRVGAHSGETSGRRN